MDFLKDDIRNLYFTYLRASILSSLIISIYGFIDTIAVGQSEGPIGTAAMSIINPLFGITVFFGVLGGMGGAVLMNNARARGETEEGDRYFTSAMLLTAILTVIVWIIFLLFEDEIFTLFGADETTLPKVREYATLMIYFLPVFIIPVSFSAFVRNDGAPGLAMAAVAIGGALNIFGDWFFVFPMGMGMRGAVLATVLGNCVQTSILLSYLFRKKCRLKFRRPVHLWKDFRKICSTGLGAGVLDLGTVVTTIIMNNQLTRYSGTTALAVYGAVGTILALFQAMFTGVGQAVQPLVSSNYAVRQKDRIHLVMRLACLTAGGMGIVFFAIGELFPKQIVMIFTEATDEVLEMAPTVMRWFFPIFLIMWVNVLAIYYLQSVLQSRAAMVIGLARSMVLSSILLLVLPLFLGFIGVLIALPLTELLVAVGSILYTKKIQPELYRP